MTDIAIRVVNEGTDAWVMVPAQLVDFNLYRLLDFERPPDLELEFQPGDLVTTIPLPIADGKDVLVAHRLFIQ